MKKVVGLTLVVMSLLIAMRCWADELHPLGEEFQVNTYTTGRQASAEVAMAPNGEFVVVWYDRGNDYPDFNGQDGSGAGVFGQRYSASGEPLGSEFQVNTYTTYHQGSPVVGSNAVGDFVVVWSSGGPAQNQDGDWGGVFGQRFAADGSPLAGEFQINTYTTGDQYVSDIAVAPSGEFVVIWSSESQDGSYHGVFGQRFDANGTPAGSEFQVNTHTTGFQNGGSVGMDASANLVIAWTSGSDLDGDGSGVFAQRVASDGALVGDEFQVNAHTTGPQVSLDVVVGSGGDFIIVWEGHGGSPGGYNMYGQRFDKDGLPIGNQFRLNEGTDSFSYNGLGRSVLMGSNGFVGGWWGDDKLSGGILARAFSADGSPLTGDFLVNTYTPGWQGEPSISSAADGELVFVWESPQDGDGKGIFGQRFLLALFADGFESGDTSAWSKKVP